MFEPKSLSDFLEQNCESPMKHVEHEHIQLVAGDDVPNISYRCPGRDEDE